MVQAHRPAESSAASKCWRGRDFRSVLGHWEDADHMGHYFDTHRLSARDRQRL